MSQYLLHQKRDGTPMGVFSETDHYYDPEFASGHENYGTSVVGSKGPATDWDDWADQLASKTPSPTDNWDIYNHPSAPLEQVLSDASDDTGY